MRDAAISKEGFSPADRRQFPSLQGDQQHETLSLSDEELTILALSSDLDQPLANDAIPLSSYLGKLPGLLPDWYMPAIASQRAKGWRAPVVVGLIASLLVIEALGLCSIFGQVVIG